MKATARPWPYPRWIAHRGAGRLAPENTWAACLLGAQHGYRMFECDARLSADGVVLLLHDETLERTTNGQGPVRAQDWRALSQLDAGGWHSPAYAGEPLLRLDRLAPWCRAQGHALNIEIKPAAGENALTGAAVANEAARLWAGDARPPLLSSFSAEVLAGAQAAQAQLPRALVLDEWWPGWFEAAQSLDAVALVCHQRLWTAAHVAQVHAAGMRCLSYTVNTADSAAHLLGLGTDGLITDRVDVFRPD